MNIAIFGGTFDPIHAGHVRAANAAARRFRLGEVLFVPTGNPPHKDADGLTPFEHRYAMVALACAGHSKFVPSLLEAPGSDGKPCYSVDTAQRVRESLRAQDRLYVIVGADAFLDLPSWKDFERLLDMADFIVVSRPGFDQEAIGRILPISLVAPGRRSRRDKIQLRHSTLQILGGVHVPVASRDIRDAVRRGKRVAGLVPPLVEQYIRKEGLYRPRQGRDGA